MYGTYHLYGHGAEMMSLSQLARPVVGDVDVQLSNEDWVSSLFPEQYKSCVSLCPTHAHKYHSLRGGQHVL